MRPLPSLQPLPCRVLSHRIHIAHFSPSTCHLSWQLGEGGGGMTARLRLNVPWLENCVRQDCDIFAFTMSNHSSLSNACYKSIISTRNLKKNRQNVRVGPMFVCGHAPWCGACPHTECEHALCISQQEIPPGASCYPRK